MRRAFLTALALLGLVSAGCQTTGSYTASLVAVSGLPLKLGHYADLNPDCSPVGDIVVRVTKSPEHGVVTVTMGEGYTNFRPQNTRYKCNFRPTGGVNVIYVSNRGYSGSDSVALDYFGGGVEGHNTFNLTVR